MKRRFFAMLLSLAMLFTLAPTAFAVESGTPAMNGPCGAASSESSVTWELTRNDEDSSNPTYTLTISGTGAMADYDVGGNRAPWYNSLLQKGATTTAYSSKTFVNITKVVITGGVTHIGAYAFAYTTVSDIQIADGVTSIGKGAFLWANWLKNITIPSSVTNMHYDSEKNEYYNIFDGTFYLESVEISGTGSPYQVVQGGVLVGPVQNKTDEYIIINCPDNLGGGNTKEITADGFPTNTTMVAAAAFSSCRSLETITLPDTITSLGTSVFAKCLSLKSFKVPDGVTTLPKYAFSGCAELESIDFNKVETLSGLVCSSVSTPETDNSTYACSSLKTLVLSKVKEIPANAFTGSAIESVTIADQAKVHAKAFLNLTSLKSVTFLGGYTIVADSDGNARPFQGCTNIETVTFDSNDVENAKVTISDNMFVDCTKLTSIDLSKVSLNDEKIGKNAFKGCTALSEVKFAANTKTISQNAFSGCTALTAVDLASSQTETIEKDAFQNCTSLATLSLPATGLTSIGASAFNENAIKHITIPSSVTEIGDAAFAKCSALEQITMSKDWSGKFSNAVKAPEGYAVGLRWYKDGTQVTPASCFSSESANPQTFEYVPIFFFDVEYNGNYSGYSAGSHPYPYRTIYKASDMSVLSAHTVKGYSDSALSITAPGGKSFAGWTLSADGIEVIATAGSTFAANPAPNESSPSEKFGNTPTITLYARWVDGGKTVIANDVIDQSVQTATYDGAAKSFGVKAAADQALPTNVTFTVAYQNAEGKSVESPTDAGTYDVTISYSGDDSYEAFQLTIKGGLVITKANGTASVSMEGWTYGETAKKPVPTSETNGTDRVTYQYKVKDADNSTYNATVPTNVGSYTVKATFPATENYEEATATTNFTIAQATPTVSITAEPASLVGGGTVKLTVTTDAPAEVVPACEGVTVTKTGDGTFSALLPNETKTYTFTATYAGDDNHAKVSNTCQVSVTRHTSSSSSSNPTYSVTTPSKSENGGVAVSSKNARKGDTVTVTVTPDAGYQLDKLTVTDKNGNVLKLTDKGDGKYSFTMPDGKVEVKAVFAKKVETSPFDDVSADAYYNQAVQWAQEKGITDGISSNLFGPKQPCTRSQIVTFLWRAAGSPEPKSTAAGMTDVVPGSYYAKAVAWAVENGITTGTAEGTFSPDATCTRAQAVTFLARAQNAKATGKTAFSDVPADSYFADAVAWAQANGVTTGTSETTFSPDSDCTRAQIVTFLYRANQGT